MKKFSYLFLSMFAAMAVLLSSCGDDDTEVKSPQIAFLAENDVTFQDASIELGQSFTVRVNGVKGDSKLTTLTIKENGATISSDLITEFVNDITNDTLASVNGDYELQNDEDEGFTFTVTITPNEKEVAEYSFTVTDKDGLSDVVSLNVTIGEVTVVSNAVEKASQVLGAQTASAPGYYSIAEGPISSSDFDANSSKINFSYGITDKNGSETSASSKLISISDRTAEGLTKNTTGGITTYFAVSSLDYATVTDAQITAISASSTSTIQIEAGKTYEFVSGSTKGLIKVISITDGTDTTKGEATISVKSL